MSRPEILNAIDDTGWVDLEFSSNFENYNGTASNNPKYRKIGNVVMLQGIATPTEDLTVGSTETEMFILPEEARPADKFYQLQQGTGFNKWLLNVNTNGVVAFSRYGKTDFSTAEVGNWLPFSIVYFID